MSSFHVIAVYHGFSVYDFFTQILSTVIFIDERHVVKCYIWDAMGQYHIFQYFWYQDIRCEYQYVDPNMSVSVHAYQYVSISTWVSVRQYQYMGISTWVSVRLPLSVQLLTAGL